MVKVFLEDKLLQICLQLPCHWHTLGYMAYAPNSKSRQSRFELMAQELKTLIAFAEYWDSVPSTHMGNSQPSIIPVPGHLTSFSDLQHQAYMSYTYIQTKCIHINFFVIKARFQVPSSSPSDTSLFLPSKPR